MPQAIGKTLTWVSHDKEISKDNVTQHTSTLQEEGIKERKNKRKTNLSYVMSAGA